MNRRHFTAGLCSCSALALFGCATGGGQLDSQIAPGYRPALASDEGGLWSMMDRAEAETRNSRFLVRDAELNAYVKDVVCRVAADHCPSVRVYLTRTPYFNASMAPNGMMTVWSGLLLRTQNEAQLAAVVGHELGHYLRRHSIERYRDVRNKADFMAFLSIGLAAAGIPAAGDIAQLLLVASIFSYNRDQEREADTFGLQLMAEAGYEPIEASKVWTQLIQEQKAKERETPRDIIFATHPASEERAETLRRQAEAMKAPATAPFQIHRDRYVEHMRHARQWMLRDEVRLRQYGPSLALLDILLAESPRDGQLEFYKGEVFRLRNRDGDTEKALAAYDAAIADGGAPPEVHRSIGFLYQRGDDFARAKPAFERYLELRPEADDREFIKAYLEREGKIS